MACGGNSSYWCYFTCFFLLAGLATPTSFISNDVLDILGQHHPSRNLLGRFPKKCTINFESLDYSIFTNTCKRPLYPVKPCCDAFKEFACPYVDDINDLSTGCAYNMFCHINQHGKYPLGLFSKKCREGIKGLACRQMPAAAKPLRKRGAGKLLKRRGAGKKRRAAAYKPRRR